ncbi:TPA: DUF4198 domain-containing protein [Enterobacter hormaechei subsp. steigerwaltii]|nr:DUF4198 domain-containing protein [Enterobacter hormaechei subsp. steigerwaltii]
MFVSTTNFRTDWFRYFALIVFSVFISMPALAHDFWILPHDAQSSTGKEVVFELRIGPGWPGVRSSRLPGLIASFDAWDAEGKQNIPGHDGALVIGHIKNRAPGATVVGLTTNGAQITLPANEFEKYLKEEGLGKVSQARKESGDSEQPGTEIFSRFAKTLVLVDGKSTGYDRVLGLQREIVPVTDPLNYRAGSPFRVRLLAANRPLANIQVKAEVNTTPPRILKAVTDAKGEVSFNLPVKGEWLFSAVDMLPSDDPDVDWHSLWASLTLPVKGV